jgi:hypothetical protein
VKVADLTPQTPTNVRPPWRRNAGVGYPFSTKNTAILGILGMVKNAKNTEKTSVCREMRGAIVSFFSPMLYQLSYLTGQRHHGHHALARGVCARSKILVRAR